MSDFSECFGQLLKKRGVTCAEAAKICQMDLSTIFRWENGRSLPESWERLEPVAKKLRFTSYELALLEGLFRKEKLGEEQSQCFDEIVQMFCSLSKGRKKYQSSQQKGMRSAVHVSGSYAADAWPSQKPPGYAGDDGAFRKLDGKDEVWQAIQEVLEAVSCREGARLCLKLHSIPEFLLIQLKQFCARSSNSQVELLLYRERQEKEQKLTKIRLLREIIVLMVQNSQMNIFLGNALDETGQAEQDWMVSEGFFLQFSGDMSYGIMTQDAEWAGFFQDSIERMEKDSMPICRNYVGALEYVGKRDVDPIHVTAMEYMPCISFGLTEEILQDIIYKEIPFREELIQGIISNFPQGISKIGSLYSYFTKEGVHEFMESGRVEIFPYDIYRAAGKAQRYEILSNLTHLMKISGNAHFFLLKEGFLDLKGIHVEQRKWKKDSLSLEFHFEPKKKEEVEIIDQDIQEQYARFLEYLEKGGYLYSEEETIAYMEQSLREYAGKGTIQK